MNWEILIATAAMRPAVWLPAPAARDSIPRGGLDDCSAAQDRVGRASQPPQDQTGETLGKTEELEHQNGNGALPNRQRSQSRTHPSSLTSSRADGLSLCSSPSPGRSQNPCREYRHHDA